MNNTHIQQFIDDAVSFMLTNKEEWEVGQGKNVWLESTNHVLRIFVQNNMLEEYGKYFRAMLSLQHKDGGWGDYENDLDSNTRVTAFVTQMLLRANLELNDPEIEKSIIRGLDYLLTIQEADGSWSDKKWNIIDATSVPTGTFIFAAKQLWAKPEYKSALERSFAFLNTIRDEKGMWRLKSQSSPVETTAHILQKFVSHDAPIDIVEPAVNGLLDLQDEGGWWDKRNVDHTCDAVRCMLYALSRNYPLDEDRIKEASERAVNWLMRIAEKGALPSHEGKKPNVLYTTDGIDTLLKYKLHCQSMDMTSLYS